ncbi:hypothetical protein GCM10018771_59880 [Streptomyces cellulosae]|nr:hypothetical protein GCM10018771_59880 [Streptomyces cellulosae]
MLLGHMGGPFFARRDAGAWTVPKGEYDPAEPAWDAARREFEEELGLPPPEGEAVPLGEVRQSGGKVVTAWAVEADLDPASVVPGTFTMEWPPRSGRTPGVPGAGPGRVVPPGPGPRGDRVGTDRVSGPPGGALALGGRPTAAPPALPRCAAHRRAGRS